MDAVGHTNSGGCLVGESEQKKSRNVQIECLTEEGGWRFRANPVGNDLAALPRGHQQAIFLCYVLCCFF
jgi:hypothetical protein